jgi:hypothetical protein
MQAAQTVRESAVICPSAADADRCVLLPFPDVSGVKSDTVKEEQLLRLTRVSDGDGHGSRQKVRRV